MEDNNQQVHCRWFASEMLYEAKGSHALNNGDDSNTSSLIVSGVFVGFFCCYCCFICFICLFFHTILILNWNVDEKIS